MLTLGRFRSMTESYGADPDRWPEQARADARALRGLMPSPEHFSAGVDKKYL